jgi:hypothetical protein
MPTIAETLVLLTTTPTGQIMPLNKAVASSYQTQNIIAKAATTKGNHLRIPLACLDPIFREGEFYGKNKNLVFEFDLETDMASILEIKRPYVEADLTALRDVVVRAENACLVVNEFRLTNSAILEKKKFIENHPNEPYVVLREPFYDYQQIDLTKNSAIRIQLDRFKTNTTTPHVVMLALYAKN